MELKTFRKSISLQEGKKRKKSFREIFFRILTVPFLILGIFWYWIHKAFKNGYEWETQEIEKWWENK